MTPIRCPLGAGERPPKTPANPRFKFFQVLTISHFGYKCGDYTVQGKVLIRRDAGQVVAGDAVTNIQNYNANASRSLFAVAFFWA